MMRFLSGKSSAQPSIPPDLDMSMLALPPYEPGHTLHWLAERAGPVTMPDQSDVYVTVGDQVILHGSEETTAQIVGSDGLQPRVHYLSGPYRGRTETIDADNIIGAILRKRPTQDGRPAPDPQRG